MTFILKSCCVTCCELANINALEIYAFPAAWPLKSTVCRERTGTIVRKTDAAHTAINVWQCTNARHKKTLWCLSAREPPRPLSLVTRWATYVHPSNLLMWSSWDFFAYHHNIKSPCSFIFSNQKSTLVLSNPDIEPIKSLSQSMAAWAAF